MTEENKVPSEGQHHFHVMVSINGYPLVVQRIMADNLHTALERALELDMAAWFPDESQEPPGR